MRWFTKFRFDGKFSPIYPNSMGYLPEHEKETPLPLGHPSTGFETGNLGTNYPSTGLETGNLGTNYPSTGLETGNLGTNYPSTGFETGNLGTSYR